MRDVCGQVLDSSRGLGMTGERGGGAGAGVTDWQNVGRPPLDPSTVLRVSGPSLGRIPDRGRGWWGRGGWGEGCAKAWGRDSLWGEESCLY